MLEQKLVNVNLEGTIYKVAEETSFRELFEKIEDKPDNIFGVVVNNEYHPLNYRIIENCNVRYITYLDEEGDRMYSRTLKFILIMAFRKLYPEISICIQNKISREIFFKVEGMEITNVNIANLKKNMDEIISKDIPIIKNKVSFRRIKKLYKDKECLSQLENFKLKLRDVYTYNECDGEINYLYGNLLLSTGGIKGYDICSYSNGIVLILPSRKDINKVEEVKGNNTDDLFDKLYSFSENIGISNVYTLNNTILKGKSEEIIRKCEADHQMRLFDLAKKIGTNNDIKLVFVAGPSSSGKTTFAQKFQMMLSLLGKKSKVISMDNYFQDLDNIPKDEKGNYDYECIENVDICLFSMQMNDLLEGKSVRLPRYNFAISKKEYEKESYSLDRDSVLIIEGIHALNPTITSNMPKKSIYKVYIAPLVNLNFDNFTKVSSSDTRLLRRIIRDFETRGQSVENTLKLWEKVKKGEDKYIYPYIKEADFLYNTSLIYELCVLKPFVEELLLEVAEESVYYAEARRLYKFIQNFRNIETGFIPSDSIIKEFIGKGCFYR